MKTRNKILIPSIVILVIGSFYLYIVTNGYSPYDERIQLTYYRETDLKKILENYPHLSVTEINDDDLKEVPRVKGMLRIALEQEFPLYDDGFALFDENLNSYWLNENDGNIRISISMPSDQVHQNGNWLRENIPGNLMKCHDRYFSFSQWIA